MSMRDVVRTVLARVIGTCDRVVPKTQSVFVSGSPRTEGNAVEMVRLLADSGVTVAWLDAPRPEYLRSVGIDPLWVRRLPRQWHPMSIWSYLRARVVFYTHGVYGAPAWPRRKTVVNLWHGEQAKGGGRFMPRRGATKTPPATYLTGSSAALADIKCERAEIPRSNFLLAGNPRTDQFFVPLSDKALAMLGLAPECPFVVWMPTFRRAQTTSGELAWSNTSRPDDDDQLASSLASGVSVLRSEGIQVVVKPHPLDLANREVEGTLLVTDEILESLGIGLYSLLGSSRGLISDYSSVWIDYLLQGSPIAFFTPDLVAFEEGRGVVPEVAAAALPGCSIASEDDFRAFAKEVVGASASFAAKRSRAIATLGMHQSQRSAHDTLSALADREPHVPWRTALEVRS